MRFNAHGQAPHPIPCSARGQWIQVRHSSRARSAICDKNQEHIYAAADSNKNARHMAGRSCIALEAGNYATVDARSAAMRSSSGGWLMNSFFAVEPEMPKAAIWVGNVLWP